MRRCACTWATSTCSTIPTCPTASATQDYFPAYFEQHPQAVVEIKRVIAEGELVMIHNLWKDTPEDRGQAVVDIFRLENGKIVEHWDVSQDIPENPANKNGMF